VCNLTELSIKFGEPRDPSHKDAWEIDCIPVSLRRFDALVGRHFFEFANAANGSLFKHFALTVVCLWAIDVDGNLWVALEELAPFETRKPHVGYPRRRDVDDPFEKRKLGHPTLLGLKPARIAGELMLDFDTDGALEWTINAHSGRYCQKHMPSKKQLENVAQIFTECGVIAKIDDLMTAN
jgi:hypothetical protein